MLDERILWVLTPAVIALVLYILFRNHKRYQNDSIVRTAFFIAVMGQAIGPRLFSFDSYTPIVMVSSFVTVLAMGFITMLRTERERRDSVHTD